MMRTAAATANTLAELLVSHLDSTVAADWTPPEILDGDMKGRELFLSGGERAVVVTARHIRDIGAMTASVDRDWRRQIAAALRDLADVVEP